ncbi:hypothetical protein [Citreimonas sp.]|uniref:hypothetical protein n=1 Tax=Citreimonas sp. TaxID=3036715 RepID=UPI0035C799E5
MKVGALSLPRLALRSEARSDAVVESRLGCLLLAALPLVVWALHGSRPMQLSALMLAVLLILAVRLIARGQRVARAYAAARVAAAPRIPRKILGTLLIGFVTFALALHRFDAAGIAALTGLLACVLSLVAFGPDPLRDKRAADAAVDEAEAARRPVLIALESALADAEARVISLDDKLLAHETTAFADHVAATLHRAARQDRGRVARMQPQLDLLIGRLAAEVARLEEGDRGPFAARRYCARLALMREAVDDWVSEAAEHAAGPESPDGQHRRGGATLAA